MTVVQLPQLSVREEADMHQSVTEAATHCTSTREVLLTLQQ